MNDRIEKLQSLVTYQAMLVESNTKNLKNLKKVLRSLRKSLELAEQNQE